MLCTRSLIFFLMTVGFLPFSPIKLLQLYNECIWFKGTLSRILCPKAGMSQNSCRLVKNLCWIKCLQVLTRVGVEHLDGGLYRGSWTALFSATPTWNKLFCFAFTKKFRHSESSKKTRVLLSPYGDTQLHLSIRWVCLQEDLVFPKSENFVCWKMKWMVALLY